MMKEAPSVVGRGLSSSAGAPPFESGEAALVVLSDDAHVAWLPKAHEYREQNRGKQNQADKS